MNESFRGEASNDPRPVFLFAVRLVAAATLAGWAALAQAFVPFNGATLLAAGSGSRHTCTVAGGAAKCWGSNNFGQLGNGSTTTSLTPVQVTGLTSGVTVVAAGDFHSCAIVSGGGVKCWGNNGGGQLGDGSSLQRLTPVAVSGLASGVVAIAAGGAHTCALTSAGAVKCWGVNNNGQLGDNTTTQRLTPVNVSGLASGVVAITAGETHTCAVMATGLVKCWGLNSSGQLGDNTTTQRLTPVNVTGIASGATAASAGNAHTCALVSGGVKCWGDNLYGELGDNTQTQRLAPVDVTGLTSGVASIAAGSLHSCARLSGSGMQCWGNNQDGELGDGTLVAQRLTPVAVLNLGSGITAITAGKMHTCALIAGGAVVCWGDDSFAGQLGDNATDRRLIPVALSGQAVIQSVSGGGQHTCATVGGGVKCWGANDSGQLGDNSTTQRLTAVGVSGLASGVAMVATGASHSCVVTTAGGVKCWGANASGQIGDGTTAQRLTPVDVTGLTGGVKAVAAGDNHTCALTNAGGVKCWGMNSAGQLGDNTTAQRTAPVDVAGLTAGVIAIDAGGSHTCALVVGGGVKCWGQNLFGQIGDSSTTQRLAPVDVTGLTSGVSAIALGQYHSCALIGGGVMCWGWNGYGQIGDNSTSQRTAPVSVNGLLSGVTGITAGNGHSCAAMIGGGLKCWGDNTYGQVGDGTSSNVRLTATDVAGVAGASSVAAGGLHTCSRIGAGVVCWGLNGSGQLGDNSVVQRTVPVDVVGMTAMTSLGGGGTHTCSLTLGGAVQCWGGNGSGQLGDGTQINADLPVATSGLTSGASVVAAGNNHSCALIATGGRCWGDNSQGQLGDGTKTQRLTPVDVSGLPASAAISASVGGDHTCAVTGGGGALCWGRNDSGQLGDGSNTQRLSPVSVSGLSAGTASISAGQYHSCALTTGGGVKCWGFNINGQLGNGGTSPSLTPVDATGLTSGVTAITSGASHSCALSGGGVKCWGLNGNGQLGDGTLTQRPSAVSVTGLTSGVAAIAAGLSHTCALTTSGGVKCWGLNTYGQLGDGTTAQRLMPVAVSGLASSVIAIAAGQNHTCALVTGIGVMCWGRNVEGQLGDGTMGVRPFPAPVLVVGPATQLAITAVNGGSSVTAGTGFNVAIESRDVGGTPAPVTAASGVSLGLVGPGALGGTPSCTLAAGTSTCTATGVTIDTAQTGAMLSANRTSGDALTAGLSNPFDVIATVPAAPTGVVAAQVAGGIQVTFTPPANTGGTAITGYIVTCNPGAITASGSASPITVTGLVSGTPYTCNVKATNAVGTGPASAPSNQVLYVVPPSPARILIPDGTSLQQTFSAYPETRWFAVPVEPGKTYAIETADTDGDLTGNAIGTLGVYDVDGVSSPPEANVDCTPANGPQPPAVDVNSDGIRCILRTAPPAAGMQQNKRAVFVKVTRMDPALGGGSQFRIRARESTVYGRWVTLGYDYHVEMENTTGATLCVEVTRYPASGVSYSGGPGWSGTIGVSAPLNIAPYGAAAIIITNGTLVGSDSDGALRISACSSPTNLVAGALHVSTYAYDPVGKSYIYYIPSTANDGKTRSTW